MKNHNFVTRESTLLSNLRGSQSLATTNQQTIVLPKFQWDAKEDKSEPSGGGGRIGVGDMALYFPLLKTTF
jgi:hypothetical protein